MFRNKQIIGLLISLLMIVPAGCETDDDDNPSPVPDVRNKFVGEWNVNDACSKANYMVNISKDPSNSARVLLQNFAGSNANQPDTALVAANSIILYPQKNSEDWDISGNGDYTSEGKIEWIFDLIISGYGESCTATYVKNK